jgi:hypothetical protein
MRAATSQQMKDATKKWGHPGTHMLVGLSESPPGQTRGQIGYRPMFALPLRPHAPPANKPWGWEVLNGNFESNGWLGTVLFGQMPNYLGSDLPYLSAANNMPVDPIFLPQPFALGINAGDTHRSWRLRDMGRQLTRPSHAPVTFADLEVADHDAIDPAVSIFMQLARAMQTQQQLAPPPYGGPPLSIDALRFLNDTQTWIDDQMTTNHACFKHLSSLAAKLNGFVKMVVLVQGQPAVNVLGNLEHEFGSRGGGVIRMLRENQDDIDGFYASLATLYPNGLGQLLGKEIEIWVDDVLDRAYDDKDAIKYEWQTFTIGHQWNLKPLKDNPTEDPALETNWTAANQVIPSAQYPVSLQAMNGGTVWSQTGEVYKFIADLTNCDNNKSLLAPGASEDPTSPYYMNNIASWAAGVMHPAPITWGSFQQFNPIILTY